MPLPISGVDDVDAPAPRFLSVETFSKTFGLSRSRGYELLDAGTVSSVRFQGRRLIPAGEVDRFERSLLAQAR